MNRLIRLLSAGLLALTIFTAPQVGFAEMCSDDSCDLEESFCDSGCAYEDCMRAPHISPSYALGFVVSVAVITLMVVNGNSHSHSHASHS